MSTKPFRRAGVALRRGLPLMACVLVLSGCDMAEPPLRVGAKDFAEQLILGQIIAEVAEAENIPVVRSIPFGGTFDNIEGLKRGDVDIYPEYNGTGLVLVGQPPISDGDLASARVEALYAPLGLVWGRRFGFHNDYELVMRADRVADRSILSLKDNLATQELLDPALPSAAILRPQPKPAPAQVNSSPTQSLINLIVIGVMIYLAYLYFCREPIWPRRRDRAPSPTGIDGSSERRSP